MTAVGGCGSMSVGGVGGWGFIPDPLFVEAWLVCITGQRKFK